MTTKTSPRKFPIDTGSRAREVEVINEMGNPAASACRCPGRVPGLDAEHCRKCSIYYVDNRTTVSMAFSKLTRKLPGVPGYEQRLTDWIIRGKKTKKSEWVDHD